MHSPPCVLIVDDNPINIKLLIKSLVKDNYRILQGKNGEEGYNLAIEEKPDLILLDIMMPGKDGYQVCEMLKENKGTKNIPVIFITAMADTSDKIKGLNLGAVDYITKPFNNVEVLARVRTQLKLKKIHEENINYQRILLESQKMASIGVLTEGVAHNFNNLLSVILCYAEILKNISTQHKEYIQKIIDTSERMHRIIENLLNFACRRQVPPEALEVNIFINKIINFFMDGYLEENRIEFISNLKETENKKIIGNEQELFQALFNILTNAKEAIHDKGKIIVITSIAENNDELKNKISKPSEFYICISIGDTGKGIKDEDKEKIFLPFFTTKNTVGVGLGLATAYGILQNHDGAITVNSSPGGSTFKVYIPIKES